MGRRENQLRDLLGGSSDTKLAKPSTESFRAYDLDTEVHAVYRRLGGTLANFPCRCGGYDIVVGDQAVELDEERHFNRYRAVTLESKLYQALSNFPLERYKALCAEREADCLKSAGYGGNWSNPSCERAFPGVPAPKQLTEPGPPRWRQRAFYDFLKDIFQLAGGPAVWRVPIYDTLPVEETSKSVGAILSKGTPQELTALKNWLHARLSVAPIHPAS